LLIWLLLGLTATTAVGSWAVYSRARAQAREVFDFQLQQMAGAFPGEGLIKQKPRPNVNQVRSDVVVRIWDQEGAEIYSSEPGTDAPRTEIYGFTSVPTQDGSWRVYSTVVRNNIVQVAQSSRVREALATDMALRAMLPLVALFPALIALVWITVGRGLKPLNELAEVMRSRPAVAPEPLPDHPVPDEVRPLVQALNELLARLDQAMRLQRSFIADAAHELRTPLTAVMLQLQLAERAHTDEDRADSLAKLKGGLERANHLVRQLLALARAEPEAVSRAAEPVNLATVVRDVVTEQSSIADAKGIDLGMSGEGDINVTGYANSLRVLLGNLVENAIRYTPSGGTIDVEAAMREGAPCLIVRDTGRGIEPEERERVFGRFYRHDDGSTTGSGLGLAIVQKLAQRHKATVHLTDGIDGKGLTVTVRFPPVSESGVV
jgi:two-component system OmpR family sensor kinase